MAFFPREIIIKVKVKKGHRRARAILLTVVTLKPTRFWEKGSTKMQMTDLQEAVAHIAAKTAEGNPAALESAPTWETSDASLVLVAPSPDGMSCVISSPTPAPLGSATVTVTAMVKGLPIQATLAVDIIASDAVALAITTDAPTP